MSNVIYNFIIPEDASGLLERFRQGTHADFYELYSRGEHAWGLQTYYLLRELGVQVELSRALKPECINLVHGNTLRSMKKRSDCFCVSLQADFPRYPLAHYHIVQNPLQEDAVSCFMPHWPQSGLVTRDKGRHEVQVVAYQGMAGFSDLDEEQLNADLNPHGIVFRMLGPDEWDDLSQVDILIGVRSFGKKQYLRKPASKLINAWHADIPFIGGWDSAFSAAGVPGEHFIRVDSYRALLDEILRLQQDNDLYNRLVTAGIRLRDEYTFDAIALKWKEVLESKIITQFEAWQNVPFRGVFFRYRSFIFFVNSSLRSAVRTSYHLPIIRRLRELHYDPLK